MPVSTAEKVKLLNGEFLMALKSVRLVSSLIVAVLVLGLGMSIQQPAHAQAEKQLAPPEIPGEAVYVAFPVPIKLDGQLGDWQNIPVQVVTKGPYKSGGPAGDGPLSFSVAADEENFYLTMSIYDKNIITGQHEANYWNEDSLEFYLNTSGDLNASIYGEGVIQVNINPGDIGNTDPARLILTGTNVETAQVKAFVFKTVDGWGFEAALPLKIKPAHGLEIGFQAQANGASEKDRNMKLIWSNADSADNSWKSPYLFGRALFFAVGSADIPMPAGRAAQPTVAPTPVPAAPGQKISVNQVGYFTDAPKIGAFASERKTPQAWLLKDANGQTVLSGNTVVKKYDRASGDIVHQVDFSAYVTPGKGYTLEAGGLTSDPFEIGSGLYSGLKLDALRYFYLSRSGLELEERFAGAWARPAGHVSDSKVGCYAGVDSVGKQWSACPYSLNALGGWYDAGDYGKYVVNGGIAVWTLLNAYERNPAAFADGVLNIPESGNGVADILDETRWEMEFLLNMQVPDDQPLAGMVHHKLHGLQWDAMPGLPPVQSNTRFLFPPSTAATLNLAATAAQAARVWKSVDADFSARCLKAAEAAWQAALAHPDMLAAEFPKLGGGAYGDAKVTDEFYWAAVELYLTTGRPEYQQSFSTSSDYLSTRGMSWGDVAPLGTISLAMVQQDAKARAALVKSAEEILAIVVGDANGYASPLLASGYEWGSNSTVLNRAIVLALAYDFGGDVRFLNAAIEGMNTLLGRNALNFSFVSGYGTQALAHPHHRFWANQPASGFPPPPPGVLAGGPNGNPDDPTARAAGLVGKPPAKSYTDEMGSYTTNEVAINWNAPLAWLAAALDEHARPILSGKTAVSIPTEVINPTAESSQPAQVKKQPAPLGWLIGGVVALMGLVSAAVLTWRRRRR